MTRSSAPSSARRLRARLLTASLLASLVIGGSGTAAASPSDGYSVTELGTLPGGTSSDAYAINGWGQIVGLSGAGAGAVLWDGGTITDLGTLPGYSWSLANGINDNGQIVGMAGMSSGGNHAVLWDQSIQDLGTLGGTSSEADGINNDGKVVGSAELSGNAGRHAFLWQDGAMADLGTLGWNFSRAYAINDAGTVVGSSFLSDMQTNHAFIWKDGAMQDLGSLAGYPYSEARALNNFGQVVGDAYTPPNARGHPGPSHAVLWDGGTIRDLGTLGGTRSGALGINDAGQVIGWSLAADGSQHAFVWVNGTMYDLGTLIPPGSGWDLGGWGHYARAIAADGSIVGGGLFNGHDDAYLLTPNSPTLSPVPLVTSRSALTSSLATRTVTTKRAPTIRVAGHARQQPVKHGRQPVHLPPTTIRTATHP